jgi:predicted HTH transcriptional regulator
MGALPSTDLKGYELLKDRVQGALDLLQEARSVDFKTAGTWGEIKKGLPKDIMAMSNLRDGGIIIIGVKECDNTWSCTGITDEQLNTYNPDDMVDHVNKYASPSIAFDVVKHTDKNHLEYLVIQAHEFEEKPVVCKKNYPDELRRGAFYIRPLGKAESREVQTEAEMHDLLELSVEKRARNFMRQIQRVGLDLKTIRLAKTDSDKFDDELEGV